eukprot:m.11498 g.11498  ORF g.11498 m.11498 type:complete len:149 (-) comp4459_c0_seq1:120-566(-)
MNSKKMPLPPNVLKVEIRGGDGPNIGVGVDEDGEKYKFSGDVKNRKANGYGVLTGKSGGWKDFVYYGRFVDGKRTGSYIVQWPTGRLEFWCQNNGFMPFDVTNAYQKDIFDRAQVAFVRVFQRKAEAQATPSYLQTEPQKRLRTITED